MKKTYISFETERLIIRPTKISDAQFMLELLNTPKWIEYIGDRNVRTVEDAENYINKKIHPQLERLGYANYTVIRKSDQIKIGTCGLYDRQGLEGIDIGFAFLPAFEMKGYAHESASRIMRAAYEEFDIEHISAITTIENKRSQLLLNKIGLKFERMIRIPDDDEELMLFCCKLKDVKPEQEL